MAKNKLPPGWTSEWFEPPETDGKAENFKQMSNEEFFDLSRQLEDRHSIFYKFWEIGKPYFTRQIQTAAVAVDRRTGHPVSFVFNPDFWEFLDEYSRLFIIGHEMLHLILRHGLRTQDCVAPLLANACMDLVINHLLCDKFGFDRARVRGADKACWRDTMFDANEHYTGPSPVAEDKAFEYYYLLARDNFPPPERKLVPGMVVWHKKTRDWGQITSVDKSDKSMEVRKLTPKEAKKILMNQASGVVEV